MRKRVCMDHDFETCDLVFSGATRLVCRRCAMVSLAVRPEEVTKPRIAPPWRSWANRPAAA